MAELAFKNFGDLYRAAFAEPDDERKTVLLSQVQRALEDWERTSATRKPASPRVDVPPAAAAA